MGKKKDSRLFSDCMTDGDTPPTKDRAVAAVDASPNPSSTRESRVELIKEEEENLAEVVATTETKVCLRGNLLPHFCGIHWYIQVCGGSIIGSAMLVATVNFGGDMSVGRFHCPFVGLSGCQCELLLLRTCTGISKLYFAMRAFPPRVFELAQRYFDVAIRFALERIVTASRPGFGDWKWRIATLPFAFGGLGVYSAGDVLNYAFIALRLQYVGLQTKLLWHTDIVASGPTFDDALSVFTTSIEADLLSNPNDVYLPIRSSLLTHTELPHVKDTFVIVCREESMEGLGLAQGFKNLQCFKIIGYPSGFKRNQNEKNSSNNKGYSSNNVDVQKNSSSMPFASDQIAKLMSLIRDKPGNGIHANMAANEISYNFGWIIDSGVNQHITSSTNNMKNVIDSSKLNIIVGHPNGTTAKIRKVGNLKLTSNIVLFDVLVIPEYCVSLLSINKLVKDSKLHVSFDEYDCIIQDLKRENILGTGSETGSLYVFNPECKALNFKSNNSFLCFNVSKGIWNNILGYPLDQVLTVLKNRLSIDKLTHAMPCEVCHHAKQVRKPFPLSEKKSDSLGRLIHLDLWGPYKVTTRDRFKYFLTMVDDYSRAVWVYLLETKDEGHKTFFDDFQTDSQASSPNDDEGEPSGSNIGSESDDTAKEQSSDDDQGSMQIDKEDFFEGNVFENNDVPTNLFDTRESNTL
nr:ribonuclease H-like domain-containing protein [Tanacetum cinerariifolium]